MNILSLDKLSDLVVILTSSIIISYILRFQLPFLCRLDYFVFDLPIDKIFPKSTRSGSIISKRFRVQWFFHSLNGLYKKKKILNDPDAIGLQSQFKKDCSIAGPILVKKIRDSAFNILTNEELLAINSVIRSFSSILDGDVSIELVTCLQLCILSRLGFDLSKSNLDFCYKVIYNHLFENIKFAPTDLCETFTKIISSYIRGKEYFDIYSISIINSCNKFNNEEFINYQGQNYTSFSLCKYRFIEGVTISYE